MVVNQSVTLSWNLFKVDKVNVFEIGWLFVIRRLWKGFKTTQIIFYNYFDNIFSNPRIITNYNLRFEVLFVYCMKNV